MNLPCWMSINYRLRNLRGVVLLIEDESIPLEVCTMMLENLGFQVISAKNGEEGLEVFLKQHENIAAVLLDLTMPKLDGKETLLKIREIRPLILY